MSDWVSMNDMAEHLSLSIGKFKEMLHSGAIPRDAYFQHGRTYRFNVARVERGLLSIDDGQLEFDFGSAEGAKE